MAIESKRGCGYRKVGGLYLVCSGKGRMCGKFPIELKPCPCCGGGVRQSRGFTWIEPDKLFADSKCAATIYGCDTCPASDFSSVSPAGLIWIGKQHYKTIADFNSEAASMGISRRIPNLPNDFVPGKTWVFLAHPEAVETWVDGELKKVPAVFKMFRPERAEKIVTQSQFNEDDEMQKLWDRGITPFVVPDDDPDHNP